MRLIIDFFFNFFFYNYSCKPVTSRKYVSDYISYRKQPCRLNLNVEMLNLGPWNNFFLCSFLQDNITFSYESEYMNFKKFIFRGTNPLKRFVPVL